MSNNLSNCWEANLRNEYANQQQSQKGEIIMYKFTAGQLKAILSYYEDDAEIVVSNAGNLTNGGTRCVTGFCTVSDAKATKAHLCLIFNNNIPKFLQEGMSND